jgi:hypothetical protein
MRVQIGGETHASLVIMIQRTKKAPFRKGSKRLTQKETTAQSLDSLIQTVNIITQKISIGLSRLPLLLGILSRFDLANSRTMLR